MRKTHRRRKTHGMDSRSAFENSIVTKKNWILVILSNFIKFDIIRPNFNWTRFCTVKNRKPKNQLNLTINRTEFAEIRSNSSKIQWNSRGN
jgi:hypothetical protein